MTGHRELRNPDESLTFHVSSRACSPLSTILTFESSDIDWKQPRNLLHFKTPRRTKYKFMNVDANLCKIHSESWEVRVAAVGVRLPKVYYQFKLDLRDPHQVSGI